MPSKSNNTKGTCSRGYTLADPHVHVSPDRFFAKNPRACIICEPSDNTIALGHTCKAQIRITAHGVSAHGSAPEKGKNAVYEMAPIIERVEALNARLSSKGKPHGTIVLSDISCVTASLNAVPSSYNIVVQ